MLDQATLAYHCKPKIYYGWCIKYRGTVNGRYETFHPASSCPCLEEYDVELEDGSWKHVKKKR